MTGFSVYLFKAIEAKADTTAKQGIKIVPNTAYKITILVRSPGGLMEGDTKITVDRAWKVKKVSSADGAQDWWQLSGQFTRLPPTMPDGTPLPEGSGRVLVEDIRIETIDGKKVN